jgi:hypothetical protein
MKIVILKDTPGTTPWWQFYQDRCKMQRFDCLVLNELHEDWWRRLLRYQPNAIIWRGGHPRPWHDLQLLERLMLHHELPKIKVYPSLKMHYLYETKIVQTRLFQSRCILHPPTYITYDEKQAIEFVKARKAWPLVFKTSQGAGSAGVRKLENEEQALKLLHEMFHGEGVKYSHKDRAVGYAYLQEYVHSPKGIIRISTYGLPVKVLTGFWLHNRPKDGWTASSSNIYTYGPMPEKALRLAIEVSEKLGLLWNMIDFIPKDDQWLTLELSDTCGLHGTNSRRFTYHVQSGKIEQREESIDFRHYIWNAILEDLKR